MLIKLKPSPSSPLALFPQKLSPCENSMNIFFQSWSENNIRKCRIYTTLVKWGDRTLNERVDLNLLNPAEWRACLIASFERWNHSVFIFHWWEFGLEGKRSGIWELAQWGQGLSFSPYWGLAMPLAQARPMYPPKVTKVQHFTQEHLGSFSPRDAAWESINLTATYAGYFSRA